MSYANGTQFYNLPQTVGTDKRDWFDTNAAFAAVDAALHAAYVGQATDAEAIATINGKLLDDEAAITSLQGSVSTHSSQITTLANSVNQLNTDVADVRSDSEDMISAYNEGAAATSTRSYSIGDYFIYNDVLYIATAAIAIGDTIIPNTNCRATNVTTEVSTLNTAVSGLGDILTSKSFNTVNQVENLSYFNGSTKLGFAIFGADNQLLCTDELSLSLLVQVGRADISKYISDTYNVEVVMDISSSTILFRAININGWQFNNITVYGIK